MPKHRAVKFPVSEQNDINVGRLACYAAAIAEDEKTTGPAVKWRKRRNLDKASTSGAVIWLTLSSLGNRNGRKKLDYGPRKTRNPRRLEQPKVVHHWNKRLVPRSNVQYSSNSEKRKTPSSSQIKSRHSASLIQPHKIQISRRQHSSTI